MSIEQSDLSSDVAVIGMSGRFPGARNVGEFWRNLREGRESVSFFSEAELKEAGVDPGLLADPDYVRARGMLDSVDLFDAAFFGFAPREAECLDPQHRVFLELAWEALENAGYDPAVCDGPIGVFAGASLSAYLARVWAHPRALETFGAYQILIGNDKDHLPTQVSYKLNLRGPSVAVQTACSTSLVAVHLACQSLLSHESDMALAGGVSIHVPGKSGYLYRRGGVHSPDGRCRAFDAGASGTVSGSGAGIVVLKRLVDALTDGDNVQAVIKGSAINNDGSSKVGYTAPSVSGQAEVIGAALAMAGVDPQTIGYVEAHGTGTPLGDPIEVAALAEAFGPVALGQCAIGSVKTNIGHLDAASGVAGLIKTVMSLRHGERVPSLHFQRPNPEIHFETTPFFVNTQRAEWKRGPYPRRAGVSSFGIGGTNAHVVVEEPPEAAPGATARPAHLLILSARTRAALESATDALAAHLRTRPDRELADVAYTLQVGRRAFNQRRIVVCRDVIEAATALQQRDPRRVLTRQQEQRDAPVAFLLPDGIPSCDRPGHELYETELAFRKPFDECAALAKVVLGIDLSPAIGKRGPDAGYPEAGADRTCSEPPSTRALAFSVEYALARLWMSWGLRPHAMSAGGVGEYVAACLGGVLPMQDALRLLVSKSDRAALRDLLRTVPLAGPAIPYLSAACGGWVTAKETTTLEYWELLQGPPRRNGLAPDEVTTDPRGVLVEIGPASTPAAGAAREIVPSLSVDPTVSEAAFLQQSVGTLWLAGLTLSWEAYHGHERRRRTELPTYPFERRRFWIDETIAGPAVAHRSARAQDPADWFYAPTWKRSPATRSRTTAPEGSRAPWLIFLDDGGWGQRLADGLLARGETVTTVAFRDDGRRNERASYAVRPTERSDYLALFDELQRRNRSPSAIVHLGCLGAAGESHGPGDYSRFDRAQARSHHGLLALAQALTHVSIAGRPLRIDVVSGGHHDVTGGEPLAIETATVTGACRVIPQEFSSVHCRNIDLDPELARHPTPPDAAIDTLVGEVIASSTEPFVAYRHGYRWVQEFAPVRLGRAAGVPGRLRPQGVYLITGGLGRIGLALGEYLASTVQARLVLVSREVEAGSGDEGPRAAERGAALRRLEATGAEVLTLSADVADAAAMRAVVRQALDRFGRIDGVVHAAGLVRETAYRTIEETRPEDVEAQFRTKVRALYVLEEALRDTEHGFCMLVSSLSAIVGGLGLFAYASANAFMDAFAHRHNRGGRTPWQSVNWEGWRPRDDGAAASALTRTEGQDAFARIFSASTASQLAVSTLDLSDRMTRETPAPPSAAATPLAGRGDEVEEAITALWRDLLGVEHVGIHDDFFELGGHSLLASQFLARLRRERGVELPLRALFESPTPAALAALVVRKQMEKAGATGVEALLEEVRRLSADETEAALAAENPPPSPSGTTPKEPRG